MIDIKPQLVNVLVDITWLKERPELKHYAIKGDANAQKVISWIYNTSCSSPEIVIEDCRQVLDGDANVKQTGLNSSHGTLYSSYENLGITNLAEIKDEWVFDDCVFLPIEELKKVIYSFFSLYEKQVSGKIEFTLYNLPPSLRSDVDDFDDSGERLLY